ncbi:unnamed protein product [Moneuplotes crassus]|uniref:C2H2-type domain-containing protein n=1 Tax=Euplotes crassus TaxID=5936 RepID=A0AAD2D6Q8_EUPCR|nr:unnamed protein product [Moneuplotes crassus]
MQTFNIPHIDNKEDMKTMSMKLKDTKQVSDWLSYFPAQSNEKLFQLPLPSKDESKVPEITKISAPQPMITLPTPSTLSYSSDPSVYCNCRDPEMYQTDLQKGSKIEDLTKSNGISFEAEVSYNKKTGRSRRSLICNYPGCGMKFTKSWNLLDHSRSHTGERPYACTLCNLRFTQKGNLNKHMKVHSNLSIESRKIYKCDHCDRKYTEKFNLNVHMRKHKGVKVEVRKKAKRRTPAQPHQDSKRFQNKLLNISC